MWKAVGPLSGSSGCGRGAPSGVTGEAAPREAAGDAGGLGVPSAVSHGISAMLCAG